MVMVGREIPKPDRVKAAEIVRDAGGTIVGRTKLQKVACLLELAGLGAGFRFQYHYYGPYSEELTDEIRLADAFGLVVEQEKLTEWGSPYSIYTATAAAGHPDTGIRAAFAKEAAKAGSIELELAATAAFLAHEHPKDAWEETERRKPDKAAEGRLEKAKEVYKRLFELDTPTKLPQIV
ncbi:MAG: hypothetical protein ABT940_09615 [Alphaproteobacteria bacterium]